MLAFVLSGLGCAFAGLCYAEFAAMIPLAGSAYTYAYATLGEIFAWIIGWDLTLEYAMGASTVSSGWSNTFVEFLAIFHLKFPLWLAYDHWTGLKRAFDIVGRQAVHASNPDLVPGTKAFSDALATLLATPSADLAAQAHTLLNAPHLFGVEIGFNLPAFLIALLITTVLVIGIKESANFNAGIVVLKVGVVLFVLGLGSHYVNRRTGDRTGIRLRHSAWVASGWRLDWCFSRISDSMQFQLRRRRRRTRSAICRSGSSLR